MSVLVLIGLWLAIPFLSMYAGMREAGFEKSIAVGFKWAAGAGVAAVMFSQWFLIAAFAIFLLIAIGEGAERRKLGLARSGFYDADDVPEPEPVEETAEAERARIVAHLRDYAHDHELMGAEEEAGTVREAAEEIERGLHRD